MTMRPVRLAVLAASPMYYQAPLYRLVAGDPRIEFQAIYASSGGARPHEAGFGRLVRWDVDVLGGYRSLLLKRAKLNPIDGSFVTLRDIDIIATVWRGRYEVLWIHGYNFLTMLLASLTQRLLGGALLFREEQTLLHPRAPWKVPLKELGLRVMFSGAGALAIGTENRRWFQHYGVPRNRIFSVPYAVDNVALQAQAASLAPKRQFLRREFGIPDGSGPVIVTVSRLIAKKQPLFLLEAFRRLRAQRACTLLVVGSGELDSAMRRKVEQERIPDVIFAGFLNQSQVPRAYSCADIFALASREHETWGLVVNEAMNFGLPLVVTDKVGSARDLVEDGGNGFIVNVSDLDGIVARLLQLTDSAALREQFGRESLRRIRGWDYETAAAGVIEAVSRTVGPRRWAAAQPFSKIQAPTTGVGAVPSFAGGSSH